MNKFFAVFCVVIIVIVCIVFAIINPLNSNKTSSVNNSGLQVSYNSNNISSAKVGVIDEEFQNAITINLNNVSAIINGKSVSEYSYTWHTDPTKVHNDVEGAPAEYFTGSLPSKLDDVYIDHELYYYPQIDSSKFKSLNYDGKQEWACYYEDGVNNEYIYATLPYLGDEIPTYMMHTEEEASQNKVLHITKAGSYILTGSWNGQIKISLGDDVSKDENQKVNLILNGANINCTVAPGIVFENLYECDNTWEENGTHTFVTNLSNAGANIIIADGSENTITGNNIYRMLKNQYKDENSKRTIKAQKKIRKLDGALYSYVSMNISGGNEGTGILNVNSNYEGIDSELHLAINSGNLVIHSGNDGINVKEDDVSTFILNGGNVEIEVTKGNQGDGVDSNGFAVVCDGKLSVNNVSSPDDAIDTANGVLYMDGEIVIDGATITYPKGNVYEKINSIDFDSKSIDNKIINYSGENSNSNSTTLTKEENFKLNGKGNFKQENIKKK